MADKNLKSINCIKNLIVEDELKNILEEALIYFNKINLQYTTHKCIGWTIIFDNEKT